jgi:hypothetical protein
MEKGFAFVLLFFVAVLFAGMCGVSYAVARFYSFTGTGEPGIVEF